MEEESMKSDTKILIIASRRRYFMAAGALGLLTLATYSNSFSVGFVFDNGGLLLQDPRIREASAENLRLIFQHTYWWPYGESGLYRPIGTLSYLFNYALLGNSSHPEGYHWLNLILQLCNMLLVYVLAGRLLQAQPPDRFWPPVFVAALWSVHPVLTESVTNIIGRVDLLAGMAVLSGLLFYLNSTEACGVRRWLWLAALMIITFVGVLSKESAVVIPGVIVLYELVWWNERRNFRGAFFGCAAVALPLMMMWSTRSFLVAGMSGFQAPFVDNPLAAAGFWTARLTALKVIGRYLSLLIWPARLSADYSYAEIPLARGAFTDWIAWIAIACVVAVLVILRRNRVIVFVVGFASLTLLPTANLIFQIGTIMAERFLYLPSLAVAMCAVIALYALPKSYLRWAPVVLCSVVVLFATRTWLRNTDWHDDLSLARATVQTSPESYKGHTLLAAALYEAHADIGSVIAEAEKSLAILDPLPDLKSYAPPYMQAGLYYLAKGDALLVNGGESSRAMATAADARKAYERSRDVLVRCDSIVKANNGRENALARARGGPEIKPLRYADLYRLLSEAELRLGDLPLALENIQYGLALSPFSASMYLQWADVLVQSGRPEESLIALMEGEMITSDPGMKDRMVKLYRSGLDPQGCAAVEKEGHVTLNPSCEVVHRHLCEGARGAEKIYTQTGRTDLAADLRAFVAQKLGCTP
jgi:tetratricopeptide (TPR) repeat protein